MQSIALLLYRDISSCVLNVNFVCTTSTIFDSSVFSRSAFSRSVFSRSVFSRSAFRGLWSVVCVFETPIRNLARNKN